MRRIADVGAAVIGTGFIGTVHVEALRRIGVEVRGVLGSTPERGAARADALGVPRAYDSLDDLLADPDRRGRPCHLAQRPARLADEGDPGRRAARRLREAAGDDRGRARPSWSRWRRPAASSTPPTSTSATTRSTSRPARRSRPGRSAMSGSSPAATSRTGCSTTATGTGASSRIGAVRCGRSATSGRTGWT